MLPNGLTLLVKEVRNAPVVSFSVWYRAGSRNEHTGITGVSHLLEHMLFKGTKQYRLGEIARTLFLNGASFNASTYYDWTNYYATIAADRLDLAVQIEADRMVNSRVDKADLDAEMTVVRSELEGGENSPGRLLWQAVTSTPFRPTRTGGRSSAGAATSRTWATRRCSATTGRTTARTTPSRSSWATSRPPMRCGSSRSTSGRSSRSRSPRRSTPSSRPSEASVA